MTVSEKAWEEYISRMRGVNAAVSEQVQRYLESHAGRADFDRRDAVRYIHALVTKYSEAAAALSCQMYDALGGLSSTLRRIPEAEPAEGPTYEDTARMVYKTLETGNPKTVGDAAARLVKRRAVDTTMQNAIRDRAEWAWIPHGDTCAFCITLASRGWQKASKKALKNGHADHIHDHCDCTYAVRFDKDTTVEGYDPEKYRAMYDAAEGGTPTEKINAMRRADYAARKEEINAQKRAAYAKRVERERERDSKANYIDITGKWYPDAKPGSHQVQDLLTYTAPDGSVYTVHGTDVVLDYDEHEKKIAELLEREVGGELYMVPRVNKPEGVKTPDYLFHGKAYDLKTPEVSKTKNAVFKRVKKASGQAHGIILDVSKSGLSDEVIDKQIDRIFWSKDTQFVDELVLVTNGKIKKVFKRK